MIKRSLTALAAALVLVSLTAGPAMAGDPFTKLGRGAANLLTGWVEIPKNIYATSVEQNAFVGMTGGLLKVLGQGIVRTAGGAYEIISFPFPAPANYEPVMQPEFVF